MMSKLIVILSIFLALILISFTPSIKEFYVTSKGFERVDYLDVDFVEEEGVVYAGTNCRALPIYVSETQAVSIYNAIHNETTTRPNTHEIVSSILLHFGVQVERAEIVSLRENTYYANLILKHGERVLSLDIRPSDAIAVALRVEAPIYVNESLLEEQGRKVC